MEVIVSRLRSLIKNSYSPYSGFRVASIVVDGDGNMYGGVNIENSSYGLTMCAERVAVFNAITSGARRIRKVYVGTEVSPPAPPCGACLQVISEFGDADTEIILVSLKTGETIKYRLEDLLPVRFHGSYIGGVD